MDGGKLQQVAPLKIEDSKISISNDTNFNEKITKKSEERAKELLGEVMETKKQVEQAIIQQQMMNTMNNPGMFFPYGNNGGNFF